MCLFKQGEIWWYEFTLEGKRYRSSTCTTDKDLALRVESEHRVSLKQIGKRVSPTLHTIKVEQSEKRRARRWKVSGINATSPALDKLLVPKTIGPGTTLQEAGVFFLWAYSQRWKKKTMSSCRSQLERLVEFFGAEIRLADFKIGHFEHYQQTRSAQCGALVAEAVPRRAWL